MESGTHVLLPDGKCVGVLIGRVVLTKAVGLSAFSLPFTRWHTLDNCFFIEPMVNENVLVQGKLECLVCSRGESKLDDDAYETFASKSTWHVQVLGFYITAGKESVE